jgi:hypothetical protein
LTALRFDESGLTCAVGTGKGVVALYDLRSSKPMLVKDHMYSSPIVDLKFKEADGGSGMLPCCISVRSFPHKAGGKNHAWLSMLLTVTITEQTTRCW